MGQLPQLEPLSLWSYLVPMPFVILLEGKSNKNRSNSPYRMPCAFFMQDEMGHFFGSLCLMECDRIYTKCSGLKITASQRSVTDQKCLLTGHF